MFSVYNFFEISLLYRSQMKRSRSASLGCEQKLLVEARCLRLVADVERLPPLR